MRREKMPFRALMMALALLLASGAVLTGEEQKNAVGLMFWAMQGPGADVQLQASDLALSVNGRPQKVDSLFQLSGSGGVRREGEAAILPPQNHDYFLLFQVYEYDPRHAEIINYFIQDVLRASDSLIVITPFNSFRILPDDLKQKSRKDLASGLEKKLRKDLKTGSSIYRSLIKQLRAIVGNISRSGAGDAAVGNMFDTDSDNSEVDLGIQVNLLRYKETLPQLEKLRLAEQERMLGLARILKNPQRRQTVFFIYQKEFRPEIDPKISSVIVSENSDLPSVQADIAELFEFYRREARLDTVKIAQAFADSGAQFHLVFINQQVQQFSGIHMREQSEDVLRTFSEIAAGTGGETVVSANSAQVIRQLVEKYASCYYLLFTPVDIQAPGFHRITLTAGNPDLKLIHRRGFFR